MTEYLSEVFNYSISHPDISITLIEFVEFAISSLYGRRQSPWTSKWLPLQRPQEPDGSNHQTRVRANAVRIDYPMARTSLMLQPA